MGVEKKKKKKRGWEKRERNGAENVYAYLQSRLSSLGSRFEGASLHSATIRRIYNEKEIEERDA